MGGAQWLLLDYLWAVGGHVGRLLPVICVVHALLLKICSSTRSSCLGLASPCPKAALSSVAGSACDTRLCLGLWSEITRGGFLAQLTSGVCRPCLRPQGHREKQLSAAFGGHSACGGPGCTGPRWIPGAGPWPVTEELRIQDRSVTMQEHPTPRGGCPAVSPHSR